MKNCGIITTLCIAMMAISVLGLPSQFDLRSVPSLEALADYDVSFEGICLGHSWARQLAQTLSNVQSISEGIPFKLSAQQLLECTETIVNKCQQSTLEVLNAALEVIKNKGLTQTYCIPEKPIQLPSQFCPRKCVNGQQFPYSVRGVVKKVSLDARDEVLKMIGDGKTALLAVIMVDNEMNYYYPGTFETERLKNTADQEVFGYTFGQIVGWRKSGEELIIRIGMGSEWGYSGYAYINYALHPTIVQSVYALTSTEFHKKVKSD